MPQFRYKGRQSDGKIIHGSMDGQSASVIASQLSQSGVLPIEIIEVKSQNVATPSSLKLFEKPPEIDDLILFSRQMYSLTKAGVSMIRALSGLADTIRQPVLASAIRHIELQLQAGRSLSDGMAKYPKIFSSLFINLVRVGENTGQLDNAFQQISSYLMLEKDTRDRIKSATRYPIIVISAIAIAVAILNIFVIPTFATVFARSKAELPWATKGLLATSHFFVAYWPYMIVGIVMTVFWFRRFVRTEKGRYIWDRLKLRIPLIGNIILRATLARFTRSFAICFRAGVPLVQTLNIIAYAVDNSYLSKKILDMRQGIERGDSFLRTAVQSDMFTPLVLQMLAVGEETGAMDQMMQEVADVYEREVDFDLKTLSQSIEPILTVAVGVLVLMLALGVFLPMWDMGAAALHKNK